MYICNELRTSQKRTPVQSESVLRWSAHHIEVEGGRGGHCGSREGGYWGPLAMTCTGHCTYLGGEGRVDLV